MTFDSILDLLESRRRESLEPRIARVCASLYRPARTAADTTGVDTSPTMLRTWNDQLVIPATTCADLRRAGTLK